MTDPVQHENSISKVLRRAVTTKLAFALTALIIGCLATPTMVYAQCTRCCFDYANVTVNPTTAEEGQPVVVTTGVFNCRPYAQVIIAKVNVTPSTACALFAEAFYIRAYVPPFQHRILTYTFAAPNCDGTYKVTESVSTASGYATTTLTVN
jgi:hypothetical protein